MHNFFRIRHALAAVLLAAATAATLTAHAATLSKYNADPNQVTVSGISSGGAMAAQMHVAYSGTFKGAAVFAGVPYNCSEGLLAKSLTYCMEAPSSALIPMAGLASTTRNWASQGLIDNTANLAGSKVYFRCSRRLTSTTAISIRSRFSSACSTAR